jgi:energy-coupling factor transport system permease protein
MQAPFRYVYRDTLIHHMNPLVKLAFVLLTLLLILLPIYDFNQLPVFIVWLALTAVLWIVARIDVSRFATLFKLLLGTFVFLIIVQGFTYRYGETVLLHLFNFWYGMTNLGDLKLEGMKLGFVLSVRVLTAASSLPLLVMTTSNASLMAAFMKLKMPKTGTFMIVSALSFTSLIFEMWANIIDAQKLRAFDIDRMNLITRLRKAYVPIITPLVLLLFRRANDFQIALETKGFGSPGRPTEVELIQFRLSDGIMVTIFIIVFIYCYYLRITL